MKKMLCNLGCLLSLLPPLAFAQQAPGPAVSTPQANPPATGSDAKQPTLLFTSAAEVAEQVAKADAALKAGANGGGVSSLPSWGPYQAHMAYRSGPYNMYFVNEDSAELFVVLDGAGTMMLGGTLVNPTRTGPHLEARTADGGVTYNLVKGDMVMVPPGMVHSVTRVDGKLVYLTMHLPLQVAVPFAATADSSGR
jgi:mannose-6-phosphate isomerase-like protein (cupin superfamily)